ncbi:hypothetical protein GTR02_00355 [Kineococcus sp. R8]|uniref:RNase A-like domain-containing protein n=1 Tax=Kineococcus siccus TaxID=2696567 RepID=UPI0014134745|nr:RNase A-like domain-containing protein [Kineococcus siccus]NAZ80272.1 hypothetical protein [Kineococcus siccus]
MDELSMLHPAAADTAASVARTTAGALTEATDTLTTATATVGGWSGTAQISFAERAAALSGRVTLLADIATAGAGIIEDYSRELGLLQARLRAIDAALAEAQARTLDTTLTVADFQSTWAAIDGWQASRRQVLDAYDDAADRLAQRLTAVIDHVPHRPRTLTEHVGDAADAVGDGVKGALWISLGWLDDPDGWWHDVSAVPATLWDQATHPVDTARDALHLDDLDDGRYGAAGGALAGAAIGKGLGKAVDHAAPGHERDGHGRAPGLSPQSLDEMLAGVDLARSEGVRGAHTISRHVDVDDQYLKDRILRGTVDERTGTLGRRERRASRWADLPTAEEVISRAVRDNESVLRSMRSPGTETLRVPVGAETGTMFRAQGSGVVEVAVNTAVIIIKRDREGVYRVHTSYLNHD